MGDGSFGPSPFPEKPMADCDALTLAGSGNWNALTPVQKQTAEYVLLCQILQALDPMADCDPLALLNEAGCASCLMPAQLQVANFSLLCNILNSITTLGAGAIYGGNGSPEGVQTAPTPSVYIQYDAPGILWMKTSGVGDTGWAPNS